MGPPFPCVLVSIPLHAPPVPPPTWLRLTRNGAKVVSVFIFFIFSWWGKGVEIEERKDMARMIGTGPRLLLSASPGTLAPQGNTPV